MKPPRNEREARSAIDYNVSGDGASKIGANFTKPGPRRVRAGGVKLDTGAMPLDAFAASFSDRQMLPPEAVEAVKHDATDFDVRNQTEDAAQAEFIRRHRQHYRPARRGFGIVARFAGQILGITVIVGVLLALALQYFGVAIR